MSFGISFGNPWATVPATFVKDDPELRPDPRIRFSSSEAFESRVLPVTRSIGERLDRLPILSLHAIQFLETERSGSTHAEVYETRGPRIDPR